MPKYEVEISGGLLTALYRNQVTITCGCAYKIVEAGNEDEAIEVVNNWLDANEHFASHADLVEPEEGDRE